MSGESWLSMAAGMRRRIAGYVYGQYTLWLPSNHMYRFYFLGRPTLVTSLPAVLYFYRTSDFLAVRAAPIAIT